MRFHCSLTTVYKTIVEVKTKATDKLFANARKKKVKENVGISIDHRHED